MLNENQSLYEALDQVLAKPFQKLHAIYEPDGSGAYGDCYCAGVDLFQPGMTYRVYFKLDENNQPQVQHLERWFFG